MNSRYRSYILTAILGASIMSTPRIRAAEPGISASAIDRLVVDARTSAEHDTVAKHYRERAKSLEAKADRIERDIREEMARPKSPMEIKWPAMIVNGRERRAQIAVQSRRAAQEALTLAQRHEKLASQAGDSVASAESK